MTQNFKNNSGEGFNMGENRNYGDILNCSYLLAMPKSFEESIVMTTDFKGGDKSSFSGSPLINCDSNESIIGMSLFFRTHRTPISQKHSLGLVLREGRNLIFLYDLCIYPNQQKSHMDRKTRKAFYGSHIHILGEVKSANLDYDSITWQDCLEIFAKDTNITLESNKILGPFDGELI